MNKKNVILLVVLVIIITITIENTLELQEKKRFYELIESHRYSKNYSEEFDCSQMTALLEGFLEKNGYKSYIVVTDTPEPVEHSYVVSEVGSQAVAIETTCNPAERLGCFLRNFTLDNTSIFNNFSEAMEYTKIDAEIEWMTNESIVEKN